MVLADYRTNVGRLLGSAIDTATWTDAILDEALRSALQEFTERGPTEEETLTATEGFEQDVSALDSIFEVVQIAWPWENDTMQPCDWSTPFRVSGDLEIWLETPTYPAQNDLIRVLFRKLYYIEDLDASAETTVADRHARTLATLGAYYACLIRLRQVTETPTLITETIAVSSGDEVVTYNTQEVTAFVSGDKTTTVTSGDEVVTTSANNNQFPPIPSQTVTTDVPTVTTLEELPATTSTATKTGTQSTDIPTATTTKEMIAPALYVAMVASLEKAMARFRAEADQRLAAIGTNHTAFANPQWAGIGLYQNAYNRFHRW